MSPWILFTGIGWLVLMIVLLFVVRASTGTRSADRLSQTMGLPLPDTLRATVTGVVRGSSTAVFVSCFVGIALAFGALVASHTTNKFEILWAYTLSQFLAIGVGTTISVLRRELERQAATVRVARMRAVTFTDYVAPLRQWSPRITVFALVLGLAVRIAITPHHFADIPAFLYLFDVATVATLVVSETAWRRVIRRGQPAGTELELAWDDALKGRALYQLGVAPFQLGAYGGLAITGFELADHGRSHAYHLGVIVQTFIAVAMMVFAVIVLIVDAVTKYPQRFLRRLWPELAKQLTASAADRYQAEAEANAARNVRRKVVQAAPEK